VSFGVLNDNLIKGLIYFIKSISRFYVGSTNVFIDISLGVQLWSE
jgi:hypothetical protein